MRDRLDGQDYGLTSIVRPLPWIASLGHIGLDVTFAGLRVDGYGYNTNWTRARGDGPTELRKERWRCGII